MQGLSHSKEQTNEKDLGKPQQNASIESFNGSLRDEHLNEELFDRLADARRKLAVWRYHCNNARPHSPLVTTNIKPADSRYDRRTSGGAGQTPKSKSAAARQLSKLRLAGSGISRHSHRLIKRRVLVESCRGRIPIVTHIARNPTKNEIEQVAERLWCDAFARSSGTSWQNVPRDSAAHHTVQRLALAAFGFGAWLDGMVI